MIGISVGALEKEFITISRALPETVVAAIKLLSSGTVNLENFLCNLVTRFGTDRMNSVRASNAYFPDLQKELAFIKAQSGKVFKLADNSKFYTYRIATTGKMVEDLMIANAASEAGTTKDDPITLCLVLTMEGLHNLDAINGLDEAGVLENVKRLKADADLPFFFVTFCHHFWNGLCGHAKSLPNLLNAVFDQDAHLGEGFHPIGLKVLMALLDKTNGQRVLIDIKHMSYKARTQYFNLIAGSIPIDLHMDADLDKEARKFFRFNLRALPGSTNEAPPVVVSHAAVNGYRSPDRKFYSGNYPAQMPGGVMNPFENRESYPDPSINLYDDDLLNIARFNCLVGIQLDEHRIAGPTGLDAAKQLQKYGQAWLVWNQVLHMIELWDEMNITNAWDRICIGSDLDGIICPLDGIHRASDLPRLRKGLLHYCNLYFMATEEFVKEMPGMGERGVVANRNQYSEHNGSHKRLHPNGVNTPERTGLTPTQIVNKICGENALNFMKTYFVQVIIVLFCAC